MCFGEAGRCWLIATENVALDRNQLFEDDFVWSGEGNTLIHTVISVQYTLAFNILRVSVSLFFFGTVLINFFLYLYSTAERRALFLSIVES